MEVLFGLKFRWVELSFGWNFSWVEISLGGKFGEWKYRRVEVSVGGNFAGWKFLGGTFGVELSWVEPSWNRDNHTHNTICIIMCMSV